MTVLDPTINSEQMEMYTDVGAYIQLYSGWNLLLEGRWRNLDGIPEEVQNVTKNLGIFADEDLSSIFNVIRAWMDQHPQEADLPSQCWAAFTSQLKPCELNEALRHRPPVRDFMAFLDSRFRIGDGVEYLCYQLRYSQLRNPEEVSDSFFKALYAWIEQNPQDIQSLTHCQRSLRTFSPPSGGFPAFHSFEVFLEAQIASENVVE
ncbi:hypothetical protein BD779DRAFT_1676717 [Infundibulicybe gibba]|nr:hypothetical protein BD779DRAFT_1676717 [Infundibulicybe gibba]